MRVLLEGGRGGFGGGEGKKEGGEEGTSATRCI